MPDPSPALRPGPLLYTRPAPATWRSLRALRAAAVVAAAALAAACGGAQATGTVTFDFDPVLVDVVTSDSGDEEVVLVDIRDAFFEANDYLTAGDYENALRLYGLVDAHAVDETFIRAARYNSALAHEALAQWREAGALYRQVIVDWPASGDAKDAHYRLAECFAQVGQFEAVPPLMARVLERADLSVLEKVEAHLRVGVAHFELRAFQEATAALNEALAVNRRASASFDPERSDALERPVESDDALIAQTLYALGRVYHELFSEIRFVLPEARLARDLVDKTQLFEQSQDAYLETVRTGNPYWGVAAGYQVGQLFEDYYFDVLATEVPSDFNEVEVEVYFEELRAFVAPALERALGIYEQNLGMAFRLGAEGEWVDATLESLERVNSYLRARDSWAEEHRQIVEGRHPHSASHAPSLQTRTPEPHGDTTAQ